MAFNRNSNNNNHVGFTAQEVSEIYDGVVQMYAPNEPSAITLHCGSNDEMLRVAPDGFYVRGVKIPQDDQEAQTVYLAFKQWLAWANLQRR